MFDINITYMYMYMYSQQYFKKNQIYIKSTEVEKIKRKIAMVLLRYSLILKVNL